MIQNDGNRTEHLVSSKTARPNKDTLAAFAESKEIIQNPTIRKRYKNVEELIKDIVGDD